AGFDRGPLDDREGGDVLDEGEDDTEREPSLGWTDMESRYGSAPTFDPDREDEHDGAEPDNEDGGRWSERASLTGRLGGNQHEDDEPSLGLTEHINQATRTVTVGWAFDDLEGDYEVQCRPGGPNNRARMADDEPDATDLESDGLERGEHDD